MAQVKGDAAGEGARAVIGTATGKSSVGVSGEAEAVGVKGHGRSWHGVEGISSSTSGGFGVYGGHSAGGTGVVGESTGWIGVYGKSTSTNGAAGVMGEALGPGVIGKSQTWMGVYGETASTTGGAGVWGEHKANGTGTVGKSGGGVGVWGTSETHEGVHAETRSPVTAALAAYNLNAEGSGPALFAKKEGAKGHAAFLDGNVWVSGRLDVGQDIICANADCAEEFDVAEIAGVAPGTVMVLDEDGRLRPSASAYDRRVVGVVSGAGSYRPAMILDRQGGKGARRPIALLGKVYCKVDARTAPIAVGDLLTTSDLPGHAMKAADPSRAFGAVIGKALRPWAHDRGLIPILVSLQ